MGGLQFVNQVSTSRLKVGDDLDSCTFEIQVSQEFMLEGRKVMLIDTPGFDDSNKSDTDVLKMIAAFLGESYVRTKVSSRARLTEVLLRYSAGVKLAGVIYVHRISDDRFGGLAAKNFRMFRQLCGEKTLKNVIIMTNMWGRVTPQQGAAREQQLRESYFKEAIKKGAQMCRHTNTPESAREILRKILCNKPVVLQIQHELVDLHKDIGQTGAGAELNREIWELVQKHQREMRELKENMWKAMKERDEEYRQELEEEKRKADEEMWKLRRDWTEMQGTLEDLRKELKGYLRCTII